jgi:hypothetical protein
MQAVPERLQSHLEPGERVLWVGSPDPRWFSWRTLIEIVGPALLISLFLGVGLVLFLGVSGELTEILDKMLDVPTFSLADRLFWVFFLSSMLVVGVAAPTLVVTMLSALGWSQRREELYAITDRGFLWQRSVWLLSRTIWPVERFSLEEVDGLEVTRHADGTSTLTFLDVWIALDADTSINPSFARIPDLDLALTIAYAAAEEAGIPPLERPTAWQVMSQAFTNWLVAIVVGSLGAVVVGLGAATLLGAAISGQGQHLESDLQLLKLLQFSKALPTAAVLMFVTGFAGLWSLAVRSRLRRYPHLHRLRRLLAWLRILLALVWLGVMAWVATALVA